MPSKGPITRRTFQVDITPEIIALATRKDSAHCVIADALHLAYPQATKVQVDLQTIRFSIDGHRFVYLTPAPAQHVIVDFDQGVTPQPQTIRSGRPIQVTKSGTARRRTPGQPSGVKRPAGDPEGKRTVMADDGHGTGVPVTVGGDIKTPVGALADPPKQRTDPETNQRYVGQRRTFGLRMLRP